MYVGGHERNRAAEMEFSPSVPRTVQEHNVNIPPIKHWRDIDRASSGFFIARCMLFENPPQIGNSLH
jgi:hypothetical protein